MEDWLNKIIEQKRKEEASVAEAAREEQRKRAVFDTKISEFWQTIIHVLNDAIQRYNQAQNALEKIVDFQKLPDFEILIQKKALPSGTLRIKLDRSVKCLHCDYSYRSASHADSQERATFKIDARHIGLPLSLTDETGTSLSKDQISETVLARFFMAV